MEETQTTSLAIASNDLSVNLFRKDANGTQKITSLDMEDPEQQDMYLNAKGDNVEYLKDHKDEELTIIGCVLTEREVEDIDDDTGEVRIYKKHSMTLFDEKGIAYVTGSNRAYNSFTELVAIKRCLPTKENPMRIKAIGQQANEKGHEWLVIVPVKVK